MNNPVHNAPRPSDAPGTARVDDVGGTSIPDALLESESYGQWLDFWHWHGGLAGTEARP